MTEEALRTLRAYTDTVHRVHHVLALLAGTAGDCTTTMAMLAAETGLNESTVTDKLRWLKDHGYVTETPDRSLRSQRRLWLLRPPL